MGWQHEEFGSSHEGSVGVLLADGTEPKPVWLNTSNSGGSGQRVSEWWVYSGKEYAGPRAAWLRGACSCGWRGERYAVDWSGIERWQDDADTYGPHRDWEGHLDEVESQALPLPEDVQNLLAQLQQRLSTLEADAPLAALRAVAAVERIARTIGWQVAFDIDPDETPWDEMGKALGLSGNALRSRLHGYAPENVRSGFRTQSGIPLS